MNWYRELTKVVPRTAWIISGLVLLQCVAVAWLVIIPRDPTLSAWPAPFQMMFVTGLSLFLAAYVVMIGYVNGDARRRGMR